MKNNTVSKRIISIALIALLLILSTRVYAANDSFSTTIKASATQVKKEENITITIGLKDIKIESGEKGIGAYTASVKFDSSVLEYVSTNGTDKWEAPFYENGLITGNTKNGRVENTTQDIGTITFKVKKDAKLGETTIALTNFSGSTVESDVSTQDKSIKLTIVDDNTGNNNSGDNNNGNDNSGDNNNGGNNSGDNNNQGNNTGNNNNGNNSGNNNTGNNSNGNNNNGNNNNNNNSNTNNKPNNVVDNTVAEEKIPKTGETSATVLIVIGVCTLLGTISFIKMR